MGKNNNADRGFNGQQLPDDYSNEM